MQKKSKLTFKHKTLFGSVLLLIFKKGTKKKKKHENNISFKCFVLGKLQR